jgi:hypothetical protein
VRFMQELLTRVVRCVGECWCFPVNLGEMGLVANFEGGITAPVL